MKHIKLYSQLFESINNIDIKTNQEIIDRIKELLYNNAFNIDVADNVGGKCYVLIYKYAKVYIYKQYITISSNKKVKDIFDAKIASDLLSTIHKYILSDNFINNDNTTEPKYDDNLGLFD